MAKVLILGAGISGHTAALHAKRLLGKNNEIIIPERFEPGANDSKSALDKRF